MRYFAYNELDDGVHGNQVIVLSEEQIVSSFFETWSGRMKKMDKEHLITMDRFIDEWKTIHWAWELEGMAED